MVVPVAKSAKSVEFIRAMPKLTMKTLDLVNVVAGGDGFSGRRNRGIDPTSGRIVDRLPETVAGFNLVGDGVYHRVEGLPLVDGVFIPVGDNTPVQIDSAGHAFDGFLASDNRTYGYIWPASVIPAVYAPMSTQLGSVNYASPGHALLELLANKGITFDLEAIRRANSDYRLLRFRAVAGNTGLASSPGEYVYADIWVFVDGKPQFHRREVNRNNGAMPVDIAIGPHDRFLTLVATDGGNGRAWDWTMFGDPRLELVGYSHAMGEPNAASNSGVAGAVAAPSPAVMSPAREYDANADMAASETGNAPAATFGAWSLGWRDRFSGTDFHENTHHYVSGTLPHYSGWWKDDQELPLANVNASGAAITTDSITIEKGQICLHPAESVSGCTVLRWTAPRAGTVNISTVFSAVENATTDVHLVHNGVSLFDGTIDQPGGVTRVDASKRGVSVAKGDVIDVVVGPGGNATRSDLTGVFHSITYVREPRAGLQKNP